jgi:hypothetical protein
MAPLRLGVNEKKNNYWNGDGEPKKYFTYTSDDQISLMTSSVDDADTGPRTSIGVAVNGVCDAE